MATTVVQVVTNPSESPTKVYLTEMESSQTDPNVSGYNLTDAGSGNGLYTFNVTEALVGIYQIRAEDASAETTGFGYVYIHADDTNTYHSSIDIGGAEAARSRYELADVEAKVDTLTTTVAALSGTIAALNDVSTSEVTAAMLAMETETGLTFKQLSQAMFAAVAGLASGLDTTTATFKGKDETTSRIVATVDANGNRSAITFTFEA